MLLKKKLSLQNDKEKAPTLNVALNPFLHKSTPQASRSPFEHMKIWLFLSKFFIFLAAPHGLQDP